MTDTALVQSPKITSISNLFKLVSSKKFYPFVITSIVFFLIWFTQPPEGLSVQTWHLFAIFAATIIAIIANLMPMGAIALIAITLCTVTQTLTIKQALSTFSSNIIWLILIAFLLARGFIKTGLGSRIAYYFVRTMGKSTLGLAYGLITTEFLLAPFTPSNTARGAGIVYPIVSALSKEYESCPKTGTERKIGSYLMKLAYQANVITSAMFLTATAGNPIIVAAADKMGVKITWTSWAAAAIVPGIISLLALPWLIALIYPPELKHTPRAPEFARQKLLEMGPLKREEWIMLMTFGLLLLLWVGGTFLGMDATVAALLGLSILICTNVLSFEDVLKEQNAWHTYLWLATLLMMSSFLSEFGLMTWFSAHVHTMVGDMHWVMALGVITLVYFYSHYAFASMTAHITSMFAAFAIVAIAAGAPPVTTVLLLAFMSSLCAGITHYGTGTGPVYFGAEYIKIKDWWRVGAFVSVVNIIIWVGVGSIWWKILGL